MKILVCAKQVDDPYFIRFSVEKGGLENAYPMPNPADMAALELALRLREGKAECEIVAATVGPPSADAFLRRLFTLGVDRGIRVWDEGIPESNGLAIGRILSRVVQKERPDLILCGAFSADMNNMFVPYVIAREADISILSSAVNAEWTQDPEVLRATLKSEKGARLIIQARLPLVLTVDKAAPELRYATLTTYLAGLERRATNLTLSDLGISRQEIHPGLKIIQITEPKPRMKKVQMIDSSLPASERFRMFISGATTKKESRILTNPDPKEAARRILQFLREEGILRASGR